MSAIDVMASVARKLPRGPLCACASCCAADPRRLALRKPPTAMIFDRLEDHRRRCGKCGRRWRKGDWFCRICQPEKGAPANG